MNETEFSSRFIDVLGDWAEAGAVALARHAWLVREKNRVMNLTRITEPEEMARRHAIDSLAAAPLLASDELGIRRAVDVGSGCGYPGLALAIALPHLEMILVDSTRKKVRFLEEVVADLGLADRVECVWSRFEDWIRPERKRVDIVLARAVGPLPRLLEWCTGRWFGRLMLWKGPSFDDELAACRDTMEDRGLIVALDAPYELPGEAVERRLAVLEYVGPA